jgi:protein-tyrosine phosphatase
VKRTTDFNLQQHPREVPDPYYGGSEGFELVLDLLEDACEGIVQYIQQTLPLDASI